jgi:hypothetical protein
MQGKWAIVVACVLVINVCCVAWGTPERSRDALPGEGVNSPAPGPLATLFFDDFEYPSPGGDNPPSPFHGWTHGVVTGSSDEWSHGQVTKGWPSKTSYSGLYVWATRLSRNYSVTGNATYYLRTPNLDLTVAKRANMSYWYVHSFEVYGGSNCDGLALEVSTDNGATWSYVKPATGYKGVMGGIGCGKTYLDGKEAYVGVTSTWTMGNLDLTPYVGNAQVSVRFVMAIDPAQGNYGWYLDDVRVDYIPVKTDVDGFVSPTKIVSGSTANVYAIVYAGGAPLEGATVIPSADAGGGFTPSSGTTNSTGWATFIYNAPSVATRTTAVILLNVSKSGYPNGSANITLEIYPDSTLHVTITPVYAQGYATKNISLRVTVTDGTNPQPNAEVSMHANASGVFYPASGTTYSNGYFWTNFTGANPSKIIMVNITADATKPAFNSGEGVARIRLIPALTVRLIAPNGGNSYSPYSTTSIEWSGSGGLPPVTTILEYSTNNLTGPWRLIRSNLPQSGTYTWTVPNTPSNYCYVRVTARDSNGVTVSDTSDGPFVITPLPAPSITITAPNGGEKWEVATVQQITYTVSGGTPPYTFNISYSTTGITGTYTTVATGETGTTYNWVIPNTPSTQAAVKVEVVDKYWMKASDTSDAVFSIVPPPLTVKVYTPNGGELWDIGSIHAIQWQATGGMGSLTIDIWVSTTGSSGPWSVIAQNQPNTGIYNWTIPNTPSPTCFIKVEATDSSGLKSNDTSDAAFTIPPPPISVSVVSPNGGEVWLVNTQHEIIWTSSGGAGKRYATIEYSTDNGATWKVIASAIPDSGKYTWTIPKDPSTRAVMKIIVNDSYTPPQKVEDVSDSVFTIDIPKPSITLISPNGGEKWIVGERHQIQWVASGGTPPLEVTLFYSTDGGKTFTMIASGQPPSGSYEWTIPDTPSPACVARVEAVDSNLQKASKDSATTFEIKYPDLSGTLNGPSPQENISVETSIPLSWSVSGGKPPYNAKLEYSINDGRTYTKIAENLHNSSYTWYIPSTIPNTMKARIRVTITDSQKPAKSLLLVSNQFQIYNYRQYYGVLTGVVEDPDGVPIEGVSVKATDPVTNASFYADTDENGTYKIYLPEGDYNVEFSHPDYETQVVSIHITLGMETPLDVTLEKKGTTIPNYIGEKLWILILILLIAIAVILILAIVVYMKRREEEEAMRLVCPSCGGMKAPNMPLCERCMAVASEPEYKERPKREGERKPEKTLAKPSAQPPAEKPKPVPSKSIPPPPAPSSATSKPPQHQKKCKDCGAPAPISAEWCDTCGSKLP